MQPYIDEFALEKMRKLLSAGWCEGKELQKEIRMSPSSVQRYLRRLLEAGHEVIRKGPRSHTEYSILTSNDDKSHAEMQYWVDRAKRLEAYVEECGCPPFID